MREIQLGRGFVAQVDDVDFDTVSQLRWKAYKGKTTHYASAKDPETGKRVLMHRLILGVTGRWNFVDHADHNGLNNQRSNIRPCSASQNNANSFGRQRNTPYIGVHFVDPEKRKTWKVPGRPFRASFNYQNRKIHAGDFATAEEAAAERDRAILAYHGEFSNLNFPERLPQYLANPWVKRDKLSRALAAAQPHSA